MKLKTVIEVDEEEVIRHLKAALRAQLHGPRFSVCDVVTFTDAVDHPDLAGQVGVVAAYDLVNKAYQVTFVDGAGNECHLPCEDDQIEARADAEPEPGF